MEELPQQLASGPRFPYMMHEFDRLIWRQLPDDVQRRVHELSRISHGVFHNSTIYFAMEKGLEGEVLGKAFIAIARNQCMISNDNDEIEGVLQNNHVGEGISTQLIEGIDSGNEYEEWLPGNEIKLWVITWKEFSRNQGAFRLIQKAVKYGNCFHCFTPLPLGMGCNFCRFGVGAVSLTLYFVNSESALLCETHAAPPAWFTDRNKPCHPFQLGLKI